MIKDLAYYRLLPYEREILPRDEESGRYFAARLKDIPEIYRIGQTKQAALAAMKSSFDDQMIWCLEEGLDIPEPRLVPAGSARTIDIIMVPVSLPRQTGMVFQSLREEAVTRASASPESYTYREPIDVQELQEVA
jgi:hypothetical protein